MTISLAESSSDTPPCFLRELLDQADARRARVALHARQRQAALMKLSEQGAETDRLAGAVLDLPAGDFAPAV